MKHIKAVIFDIDDTLVNRKEAFLKLCDYLIDKYAKDYPYDVSREDLIHRLIEIDAGGYGGLHNVIPKLQNIWKLPHSVDEFIKERNEVFGKLTTTFPETYEVLEALKGKYKLGVITNGYSKVQREKIEVAKLEHYFDDIIVSGEEEFEKPDSRIFLLASEHLGVKPEEAVFIGDYYANDIAGAISANMMPIWINDQADEHPEYQGLRVSQLKEILKILL